MVTEPLLAFLVTLVMRAPSLVVGGVGLYFAIARRKLHPRVSSYAIVGFSCLLATVLMFFAMQLWVRYGASTVEPSRIGEIISYWNLAMYPVNLVALAAIGVAVFIDRWPTSQ